MATRHRNLKYIAPNRALFKGHLKGGRQLSKQHGLLGEIPCHFSIESGRRYLYIFLEFPAWWLFQFPHLGLLRADGILPFPQNSRETTFRAATFCALF